MGGTGRMRKVWKQMENSARRAKLCCLMLICVITLTACGGSEQLALYVAALSAADGDGQITGGDSRIVGTWVSEDHDDMVVFNADGSCSAPFTFNASWIESADHYLVEEDGTLIFSSNKGHANASYKKTESKDEALEEHNMYYISRETLIIEGDTYTKAE